MSSILTTILYFTSCVIVVSVYQLSQDSDICNNATYSTTHHHAILDSIKIINNSLEIKVDIKVTEYCYSCTIIHIDNLISISIDSLYNILQISVNNTVVKNIPNANTLLPIDNAFHRIYLSNSLISDDSIFSQNIFKIDKKLQLYYGGSILAESDSYKLYVGDAILQPVDSLNASIKNVCVNSSIKNTGNIDTRELRCGDQMYGELTSGQVDYYYFQLTHTSNVIFDSCESSPGIYLDIHTIGYSKIPADIVWEHDCYPGPNALIPSLPKGRYLVEMGVDGNVEADANVHRAWQLQVSCNINRNHPSNYFQDADADYILPEIILDTIEWFEAERKCEQLYGTTLATIITDDDLVNAFEVINNILDISMNVSVWIGLAQTNVGTLNWQWVDDTTCSYTTSGDCIDDLHWQQNQPDGKPISYPNRFGATLFITKHTNRSNLPTFIALPMDADHSGSLFFLCNGPNSKHTVKNCSDDLCWQYDSYRHQFSDYNIESDVIGKFNPFIGHWNRRLIVVGRKEVHYTDFAPFNDNYNWNHEEYNNISSLIYWNNAQLYTQYDNLLYIYGTTFNDDTKYNEAVLLRVDLDSLDVTREKGVNFVESTPLTTKCIVAEENAVYLIQQTLILLYKTHDKQMTTSTHFENPPAFIQQSSTTSCVRTEDGKNIYIFAMTYVSNSYHVQFTTLKYEIQTGNIIDLDTSDKCLTRNGFITAVAAKNGDIYLHGCNAAAWKTMIFSTTIDQFKNETVNIGRPIKADMPYYRSSKMVEVDNNILYLYAKTASGFDSYFTVTNLVSINIDFSESETMGMEPVWPSDGFDIEYYMNIFTDNLKEDYHAFFVSNSTKNTITQLVTFNRQNDYCNCLESVYQCYDCQQHFNLENYLTFQDDTVDSLLFTIIYADADKFSNALITPNSFTIPLQRCVISITKPWEAHSHSIVSRFELSTNCYSRYHTNFSVYIEADSVFKELSIGIVSSNETNCKVCDFEFENGCIICDDNRFTIVSHLDGIKDTDFNFNFSSNMVDVKVLSPLNSSVLHWRDNKITRKNYGYYALFVLIPIAILLLFSRRQYMNAFIVDKALVLIIPIENFDDEKMALPGVRKEMISLEGLWRDTYNYDVFVCNKLQRKSNKEDIIDFFDNNLKRVNEGQYKAIMVHIMSHGQGSTFKTSDMKNFEIDFIIHEMTSIARDLDSEDSDFIKLIWNHVCQGENNYSSGSKSSIDVVTHEEKYRYVNMIIPMIIPSKPPSFSNNNTEEISPDSNVLVISGNVPGRTMSDSGEFTECIFKSFKNNLKRMVKVDFNTLMVEIRRNLKDWTMDAELVHTSGNLLYSKIRFEKNKETESQKDSEMSTFGRYNRSNSLSQYQQSLLHNTDSSKV